MASPAKSILTAGENGLYDSGNGDSQGGRRLTCSPQFSGPASTEKTSWNQDIAGTDASNQTERLVLLRFHLCGVGPGVLPHITRSLHLAELIHEALVWLVARGGRADCPELIGQDRFGQPLSRGHQHAHILPLDLDHDGHLDHVLIWTPMGLGPAAQDAVRALRFLRIQDRGSRQHLHLSRVPLAEFFNPSASKTREFHPWLGALIGPAGANPQHSIPDDAGSRHWVSLTPFIPPRYLKKSGKNSLVGQVAAELVSRGFPDARSIRILDEVDSVQEGFTLVRTRGGRRPPQESGYGVRIEFDQPVQGPLVLGYASHFGMGLFQSLGNPSST